MILLMWMNVASSSDGRQLVYTGEAARGHGGVRADWVLGCLLEQVCVCVRRLDSGELLMSADRVRHAVTESKGPLAAISKQPTCRKRQIWFCRTGSPTEPLRGTSEPIFQHVLFIFQSYLRNIC